MCVRSFSVIASYSITSFYSTNKQTPAQLWCLLFLCISRESKWSSGSKFSTYKCFFFFHWPSLSHKSFWTLIFTGQIKLLNVTIKRIHPGLPSFTPISPLCFIPCDFHSSFSAPLSLLFFILYCPHCVSENKTHRKRQEEVWHMGLVP